MAWLLFLAGVLVAAVVTTAALRDVKESDQLSVLTTEASRSAVELMGQTLNGNLMGSVSLLGLVDPDIKREVLGQLPANSGRIVEMLESVGRTHDAEGVFVVSSSGIVGSSWDNSGKRSTGLDVKFRPYYQMSMQGMGNVYAAVSMARGDRSLYFAAPVFVDTTNGTDAIGVVVARTGMLAIDNLLRDKTDIALLLSPQGVVFASNRPEWVGRLSGQLTPERLKAIRELKQFGAQFDGAEPALLPFSVDTGVHATGGQRLAVARAAVEWNDPFGDWTLVLIEDLDQSVPFAQRLGVGALVMLLLLILGTMMLKVLESQHRQVLAAGELMRVSQLQQMQAEHKEQVATAAVLLQYAKTPGELTQTFLGEMHRVFGALQGVVYLAAPAQAGHVTLSGTYASAAELPAQLALGEGLLGQCALDRRVVVITDVPAGEGEIHSGLGSSAPAALFIAPIMLVDQFMGVVELSFPVVPDELMRERMLDLTRLLAMNLEIVGRTVATQETLSAAVAAEQAQAGQLLFQQALIDTIPYPVFYKGADSRFLGVNRAYETAFSVKREDLVGKRVLDLDYLPEAERLAYQAEDEKIITTSGVVEREVALTFSDQAVHDTRYFVAGFRLADGAPGGLVGTFIDISSLRQAEHALERLSDVDRFNQIAQGREQRILALKQEINALAAELGRAPVYESAALSEVSADVADFLAEFGEDLPVGGLPEQPALTLPTLVDLAELQTLLNAYCALSRVAVALVDPAGAVLAASGWPEAPPALQDARAREALTLEGQHLADLIVGGESGGDAAPHLTFLANLMRAGLRLALDRARADAVHEQLRQQADTLQGERLAALSVAEDAERARRLIEELTKGPSNATTTGAQS